MPENTRELMERGVKSRTVPRSWAGYAACAWALGNTALRLHWATVGKADRPRSAGPGGVPTDLAVATASAVAATSAFASVQPQERLLPAGVRSAVGWGACALLLAAGPGTLILDLAGVVTLDLDDIEWADFLHRVFLVAGGVVFGRSVLNHQRRVRGACARCGRGAERNGPRPRVNWIGYAAAALPLLGFAVPHWLWALGVPFGIPQESADQLSEPGLAVAVAALGGVASAAGVATLALVRPWGERVPAAVPFIGGKKLPKALVMGPPLLAAAALTPYGLWGLVATVGYALGLVRPTEGKLEGIEHFGNQLTYATFFAWGVSLGAAAIAYHYRTRGTCRSCGRSG
ncbi:hypothetical protein [Streptomyces sp. NBRC 109706]|uniref:hypothetical protein n=1 Tax=Streptomyces sp. NBRC 109706 TaxID=1550035 RepID=UPI000780D7BA|nr:hypothetical protein [Streptomyces sp. NBRC 109706]